MVQRARVQFLTSTYIAAHIKSWAQTQNQPNGIFAVFLPPLKVLCLGIFCLIGLLFLCFSFLGGRGQTKDRVFLVVYFLKREKK